MLKACPQAVPLFLSWFDQSETLYSMLHDNSEMR